MRKSKEEASQTRKRIVATAAAEFRRTGIVGTGIADLMQAAGLTNGGFYRHFESKEQLVAEASTVALSQVTERMAASASGVTGEKGLERIVHTYLGTSHRDNPQTGCLLAALGSELTRADLQTRKSVTQGFLEMADIIAAQLTEVEPAEAHKQAMVTLFTMIGALTMSRVVADEALSGSILLAASESLTKS